MNAVFAMPAARLLLEMAHRESRRSRSKEIGQLNCVVDTAIETEPAERVVHMRRIAREEDASPAKLSRHPLMDSIDIAMDDWIAAVLAKEFLQASFGRFLIKGLRVGFI